MNESIIHNIVNASGVKPKELILVQFWGEDKDIGFMHSFASAVTSLGASPIEFQQSRTVNAERFAVGNENSFSENYFQFLSNFDAVLDILYYRPVVLDVKLDDIQTGLYRRYMASLFKALTGAKRFTQIRIPSLENSMETDLPPDEYIERMNSAYAIDYAELLQEGSQRIKELSKAEAITLVTGDNCELYFQLSDREWHLDAGDGDMPCGEIYIAPLETETNGMVFYEKLYAGDWGVYHNVTLIVENGVVTSADDDALSQQFAELDIIDRTVCELGFGLNRNIRTLCGFTVLDEKAYGTFHIAIGSNTMFGGTNPSQLHIDFVGTATINQNKNLAQTER